SIRGALVQLCRRVRQEANDAYKIAFIERLEFVKSEGTRLRPTGSQINDVESLRNARLSRPLTEEGALATMERPYGERRGLLDELDLGRGPWYVPDTFKDGEALLTAVCAHG